MHAFLEKEKDRGSRKTRGDTTHGETGTSVTSGTNRTLAQGSGPQTVNTTPQMTRFRDVQQAIIMATM